MGLSKSALSDDAGWVDGAGTDFDTINAIYKDIFKFVIQDHHPDGRHGGGSTGWCSSS